MNKISHQITCGLLGFWAAAWNRIIAVQLLESSPQGVRAFIRLAGMTGLFAYSVLSAPSAFASGQLAANKLLQSNPTPFAGEFVEYRLEFSCSGITGSCGGLDILDTIPAELEIVSCLAPPGFTITECDPGTNDIAMSKDTEFNDGEAFTITIRTRVRLDAPITGLPIVNTADVTIVDGPGGNPQNVTPAADPVIILPGTPRYVIRKARIAPAPPLEPAADTDIVYTVQYCTVDGIGNTDVNNPVLTDTVPPGAIIVNAGGGTINGNEISWVLDDFDLATAYQTPADTSQEYCQSRTYIINYPSDIFPQNAPINNLVVATGDPESGTLFPNPRDDRARIREFIGAANPGTGMEKTAADVASGAGNGPMVWNLNANIDTSNVPVLALVVYEEIPQVPVELLPIEVTSGVWNSPLNSQGQSDVQATIQYATTAVATPTTTGTTLNPLAPADCSAIADANWINLSAGQIPSPAAVETYALPNDASCLRWVFADVSTNASAPAVPRGWAFGSAPQFSMNTEAVPGPFPVAIENCMYSYFDADGIAGGDQSVDGPSCGIANIENPTPALDALKTRLTPLGDLAAGQQFIQRLSFTHIVDDSTGPTVNPIFADLLPPELEFVRWNAYTGNTPEPVMEVIEDYNLTGRTMVRFSWSASAPAGSIKLDGSDASGLNNNASFSESLVPVQMPQMDLVLQVKPGTPAGTYTNAADLFDNSPNGFTCANPRNEENAGTDGNPVDLDGDGDAEDNFCVGTDGITVIQAAVLGGKKFVRGSGNPLLPNVDDPTSAPAVVDAACEGTPNGLTRYPCVAQTGRSAPGNFFNYELELTNNGNVLLEDYYLYDVLPFVGDTGTGPALAGISRGSIWEPDITGDITPIAGSFLDIDGNPLSLAAYTSGPFVEYSVAATPCRNELDGDFADEWPAACDNTYVDFASIPGGDLSAVTAFRIRMPFDLQAWPEGASMRFDVPMLAPEGTFPSIAGDPTLFNPAWNSFSHRAREDDTFPGPGGQAIPASEPRKVGIILEPSYRIGNLIWLDADNDGIAEAGEPGLENVDVQLWRDTDSDGQVSAGDALITTTTTDSDGKYVFLDLSPTDYYVLIPDGQDNPGGPLNLLFQSNHGEETDPNDDIDNNDNGVNIGVTAGSGADQTTGLASGIVTLGLNGAFNQSEPTNETLRRDDASDDDGDVFPDTLSNVSVDFGYYRPFNLGNRVWLDNGDDGAGNLDPAIANNGLIDPNENGIDGLTVTLLNDDGTPYDSDPDTAAIDAVTTTTANDGYYLFENIPAGDYRVELDLSGGFEHLKSSTGTNAASGPFEPAPDPDDDLDSVDDGVQTSPTKITSGIVTLGTVDSPAEPIAETDTDTSLTNSQGNDPYGNAISDNQANMTVDFGLFESYSIGNRVWIEDDNNGIFNPGESPTNGIEVRLFEDFDNDGNPDGPAIASMTTANGGHYRFDNLLGGQYILESDIPAGTRSSEVDHGDPDNDIDNDDNGAVIGAGFVQSLPVTVGTTGPVEPSDDDKSGPNDDGSGNTAAPDSHSNLSVDFGFVREYSIGSYVWDDVNGNGLQDAGELPIENALVELVDSDGNTVTDMDGNPVIAQTTGTNGQYFFELLPSGDYKVRVTPPLKYIPSPVQNAVNDNNTANDSNIALELVPGTHESGVFTLELGAEPAEAGGLAGDTQDSVADAHGNMSIDFGFYEPLTLGNLVWEDTDNDGLFNNGETGIDDVSVRLYRDSDGNGVLDTASDQLVGSTLTAGGGFYQFDELIADDYFVFIPISNKDAGEPLETLVSSTGASNTFEPAPDPDTSDTDNDDSGTLDVGIGGFVSQPVTLSANDEPGSEDPTLSGTAGFDGTFVNGLPHDDADSNLAVDFGFTPSMTLGSAVFLDNNNNGIQDSGENGFENSTVQLFDDAGNEILVGQDGILGTPDDGSGGVSTNATGVYNFSGLPPGDYVVRVTPAEAYVPSSTQEDDSNTDINLDSNIDDSRSPPAGSYESNVVVLSAGTEPSSTDENDPDEVIETDPSDTLDENANLTVDFGFIPPVSIGSTVFFDNNNNGFQDANDAGIAGLTVTLYDSDGINPVAGVPAVVTDMNGDYLFDNLLPGDYVVGVAAPATAPTSSFGSGADDQFDSDDNGIQGASGEDAKSVVIHLEAGLEPLDAVETGQAGAQETGADNAGDMTIDFGFIPPVSIGSYVWEDTNGNGLQDAGEPAITEGTVALVDLNGNSVLDHAGNPVLPIDLSLTSGQYIFDKLLPGDYKIRVTPTDTDYVPSPTQQATDNNNTENDSNIALETTPNQTYESPLFTLLAGSEPIEGAEVGDNQDNDADNAGNMTVDFGFVKPMSIGSYVWEDTNGDGIQDAAEIGINGVTVSLLVDDGTGTNTFIDAVDLDGVTIADVTTANDGTDDGVYLFDNLPPGNYKIQITDLPAGFMPSSTQNAGDDDVDDDSNIASEPTAGVVFESGVIALGVDQEPLSAVEAQPGDTQDNSDPADANSESNGNMTIDFGFVQVVSIGSYIWEDLDVDGVQDDTEPAIEGATVELLLEDPANPGTYIPAVDVDGDNVPAQITGNDGLYYFAKLPEGTYKVRVTPPAIFIPSLVQTDGDNADTTAADELDSNIADEPVAGTYESGAFDLMYGEAPTESGDATGDDQDDEMETSGNMTVDFGFIQPVSIGSYVWEDTNGDGFQNTAEPAITAGTVELFNADGSAVTNLDGDLVAPVDLSTTGGQYIFDNLLSGDYKVRVTPTDTTLLISANQTPGDDDTENDSNIDVDSGAAAGSFESGIFTLTPGTEPTEGAEVGDDQDDSAIAAETSGNMTVDFGFVPPVSLGSTVFFDNNNNGIQDGSDAGIPGVLVTLYEDDGVTPVEGVEPVVTDTDGNYFFEGLLPGDYVVGVMAPTSAPTSSQMDGADDGLDSDDNGIQANPGEEALSAVITLLAGDESVSESGQGGFQDVDAGGADDAGDMTIDFGFVPPVSIGSTVFFDNDDNGIQGDGETGIAGVTVTLYQNVNGALEPVPGVPPVLTDSEGTYLFENLLPGVYVVGVMSPDDAPGSSALAGGDDGVDSDNNGIQTASGDEAFSAPIDLEAGTEPVDESGQGGDQDSGTDNAGDMTIDFGFVPLPSEITLIKTRADGYPIDLGNGDWRVRFNFEVENTGDVELTGIQIIDDLEYMLNSNVQNRGVISEIELESPDMTLSPNPAYNGYGDTNMLDGTDVMSVGESGFLTLTFKFTAYQFFGPFRNIANVTGIPPNEVPEDDEDEATVKVLDLVKPITLGWFSSGDQGNGEVIFKWATQTEVGNVGYYLWSRAGDGEWSQINEDMIVSQGDSLEEQVYQYSTFTVGDEFRLTDVSMSGKQVHHGPYQLGEEVGVRVEHHPTDWEQIQRQSDEKQRVREQRRRDEMQLRLQQLQGAIDHKPASGLMSKVGLVMANLAGALIAPAHALELANFDVESAGIYRVTHEQLAAAGLNLEGYSSDRIGLKSANSLAPLKILPSATGTFGAGSSIEFPALGVDTLYAGSNIYTLVLDEGQNMIAPDERAIPAGPPAYSYMAEVVHAPQNVYAHFSPDDRDAWYAYRVDALNNASASKSVSLSVTDHALAFHTSGAASDSRQIASKKPRLEVKLWGASTLAGNGETDPDHHVTVSINGSQVADERFDGIRKHVVSKPLAQINSGNNTIRVDLPNDHSYPFDRVDIDSVTLLYPRQFKADDNGRSLVFPSSWNKFVLQKFSSTDVVVYRLDSSGNADEMMQHEGNCDGGAGNCVVSFAGIMSEADDRPIYFASTQAGIKLPHITMAPPHEELFSGEAKMLVIAHPDFIGTSLSSLEGYSDSMAGVYGSSDIVNVESIYAQYSGQVMDARAIHQYIIDAVATRGTEHVILVGGDMYDYRNNLGTSGKSFVPSLYVQTGQNQSTVPSDPKYADIDDDDIPDIDIARLPVRTEAELEVLLSKRQSYLTRSYTGTAVFSADKTDESGDDFDVTSEQWVSNHFSDWSVSRAYIDNLGSGAKQVVSSSINAGTSLTSYTGHSSTYSWSFDDLFNSEDVSALSNAGKPTVVAQWGCWNTFYSSPEQESIAQTFLVEGDKGAVVVMGATSLAGAQTEDAMADLLYARLSQGMRIGDAVLSAKRAFADVFPGQLDMLLGWTVLGPADLSVN